MALMVFILIDETADVPVVPVSGLSAQVFDDDAPCPRVGLTITGLSPTVESVVTVWRSVPGEGRLPVRGLRDVSVIDATYLVDYEVPLGRPVTYTLEVSGPMTPASTTATVTVVSDTVWMQDPLDPTTAVAVSGSYDGSAIWFASAAFASIGYSDPAALVRVMNSRYPTALGGGRGGASDVPFDVYTDAIEAANRLRILLGVASPLLLRTLPPIPLPALAYLRADASEQPVDTLMGGLWSDGAQPVDFLGGSVTYWGLRGDLVAAPSIHLVVPTWTYAQVSALYETYAAAAARGGTYLDWMKDPTP